MPFIRSPSRPHLALIILLYIFLSLTLVTVAQHGSDIYDFDVNGRRVSYYPESLMLSHNPQAIVFYHDTKLLNLFIDLRVPDIGRDFVINNTCDGDQSYFLSALLGQMRNIQKSIQRIQSSHGYTSLIECELNVITNTPLA